MEDTKDDQPPLALTGLLGGLLEFVCENLPEDWKLQVSMSRGEASFELIDPDGETVEMCDDDLTEDEMIVVRVNHARQSDGLQLVECLDDEASRTDFADQMMTEAETERL